jgi:hypothetical protein
LMKKYGMPQMTQSAAKAAQVRQLKLMPRSIAGKQV